MLFFKIMQKSNDLFHHVMSYDSLASAQDGELAGYAPRTQSRFGHGYFPWRKNDDMFLIAKSKFII